MKNIYCSGSFQSVFGPSTLNQIYLYSPKVLIRVFTTQRLQNSSKVITRGAERPGEIVRRPPHLMRFSHFRAGVACCCNSRVLQNAGIKITTWKD